MNKLTVATSTRARPANGGLSHLDANLRRLRAVFHFMEELAYRDDVKNIPESDRNHLANDIKRAYQLLIYEWLDYMKYLKANYPFLFHLAMRTNPFDRTASVTVK